MIKTKLICMLSSFLFLLCANDAIAAKKVVKKMAKDSNFTRITEKSINVIGVGETKDNAIKDALRNAVEKATGVFIYSVTEVNDFKIERDKIIASSRGFVKEYKVIKEKLLDNNYFIIVNVEVNTDHIKSILREKIKAISYEDAIKDYTLVTERQERLKKFSELLKLMSSRPTEERYLVDYAGYEIVNVGLSSIDVILKFRIAMNPFFWDEYFKIMEHVSDKRSCQSKYYNNICADFYNSSKKKGIYPKKIFCIHRDLNDSIIKPEVIMLEIGLDDNKTSCRLAWLYNNVISSGHIRMLGGIKDCQDTSDAKVLTEQGEYVTIPFTTRNKDHIKQIGNLKAKIVTGGSIWNYNPSYSESCHPRLRVRSNGMLYCVDR
jgi:hypothetical protein